jgi:multicomponent Na+:H+ antiporter subunit C
VILISSAAIAVLFGAGCYLLLKHDLVRLIFGMVLIGNAANLFIMSAGLRRGSAPIYPVARDTADPLVQAMTLTAIVISFAVSALVLGLAWRVYASHASVDTRELSHAEEAQAELDDAQPEPGTDHDPVSPMPEGVTR